MIERIPPWLWLALIVHGVVMTTVAYLILLERKVASWVQDRIGPNRVGPWGLLQPIADGLKFLFKEDYRPGGVDRWLFTLGPASMMIVVIVSIAVIPWGGIKQSQVHIDVTGAADIRAAAMKTIPYGSQIVGEIQTTTAKSIDEEGNFVAKTIARVTYQWPFQIANLNIGVLFIIAVLSMSVYGVVIGGWASNNKYSFLGALRATANMISYEIPLGLAILTVVTMYGTLDLASIVSRQAQYWHIAGASVLPAWNIFTQPLTFLIFLVCIHAEANRAPFDLAEAEQELVGGYHTEYSAMRFGLFFLGEYAGMITTSAVCVALFFGGWHLPWIEWAWPALAGNVDAQNPALTTSLAACAVRAVVFFAKIMGVLFVFMWVRWSLPRFRFDQLMMTAWRALIPLSLGLLACTALAVYWLAPMDGRYKDLGVIGGRMALALLGSNVAALAAMFAASRLLPAPAPTNRRLLIAGSRFQQLATSN